MFSSSDDVAFWVTTGHREDERVRFTEEHLDRRNNVDLSNDQFIAPITARYFLALSGAADESMSLRLTTKNTDPILNLYTRDDTHDRPVYTSLDAIVRVDSGSTVDIEVTAGRTFNGTSDDRRDLTSLSMFNIDDAMVDPSYFYADRSTPTSEGRTLLQFPDIHTTSAQFTDNTKYICKREGQVFLFLSVGALHAVRVEITHGSTVNNEIKTYELMDLDTIGDRQNIVSRSILVNCAINEIFSVYVYSTDGTYSGPHIRSSFGGFLYDPSHNNPVAWSTYRNVNFESKSVELDYELITFRSTQVDARSEGEVIVNIPTGVFSQSTSKFTAPVSGVYLVHLSASIFIRRVTDVALFRNNERVASIYDTYTGHNGKVTVSRTILIHVIRGQTLDIRAPPTTILASNTNSKDIAFMGMLIYED